MDRAGWPRSKTVWPEAPLVRVWDAWQQPPWHAAAAALTMFGSMYRGQASEDVALRPADPVATFQVPQRRRSDDHESRHPASAIPSDHGGT
jgi:hypothetical protein